jgi:hypothetical protein
VIKGHRSVLPEIDGAARSRASNDANLEERHTGTVAKSRLRLVRRPRRNIIGHRKLDVTLIKMVAYALERASALEAIKIAVIMEWSPHSATRMPATTRRTLPSRLEPKPRRRRLGSWAWATLSTGDPAGLVVLDSTLTPAAVMIGGIWIG